MGYILNLVYATCLMFLDCIKEQLLQCDRDAPETQDLYNNIICYRT